MYGVLKNPKLSQVQLLAEKEFSWSLAFFQAELEGSAMAMISDLRLEDKSEALASSLSGGMQRRLCIGIAFIAGKHLILTFVRNGLVKQRLHFYTLLCQVAKPSSVLLTSFPQFSVITEIHM